MNVLHKKYGVQKAGAKARNIVWDLTFDEWITWWENTHHLDERGNKRNQYVMARFNDEGPYALDNIKCITAAANMSERVITDEDRKVMSVRAIRTRFGIRNRMRHTFASKAKLRSYRLANPKKKYPVKIDNIIFRNSEEAGYFMNRCSEVIKRRVRSPKFVDYTYALSEKI